MPCASYSYRDLPEVAFILDSVPGVSLQRNRALLARA
jgi:hypothetical protein